MCAVSRQRVVIVVVVVVVVANSSFWWDFLSGVDRTDRQKDEKRGRKIEEIRAQWGTLAMSGMGTRLDAIRKRVSFFVGYSLQRLFSHSSSSFATRRAARFTSTCHRVIRNRCLFYETFYLAAQPVFQYFAPFSLYHLRDLSLRSLSLFLRDLLLLFPFSHSPSFPPLSLSSTSLLRAGYPSVQPSSRKNDTRPPGEG